MRVKRGSLFRHSFIEVTLGLVAISRKGLENPNRHFPTFGEVPIRL